MHRVTIPLLLCLIFVAAQTRADNWPQWRGPTSNGVAPDGKYPTGWSEAKNVYWKIALSSAGSSTPIVWDDSIFVSSAHGDQNTLIRLDRNGNATWRTPIGKIREGKHKKASSCNPSPTTDGEFVFAYYKSGDLACVDFDGKILWHKNLQKEYGEDTLWWDLGTSPTLTKNHVIVAVIQTGDSYLAAFEKKTGKVAWKVDRNLGAPEEAAQTYATPMVVNHNGQEKLVVLGADHVTAHSASNGKELWRVSGMNPTNHKYFRSISSPVVAGDIVVAPYSRGDTIHAVKLGGSGDVSQSHLAWQKEGVGADVPTPLVHGGRVYFCVDKGKAKNSIVCFDLKTGDEQWSQSLGKSRNTFSASPIMAGGHIYATREDGVTFVVAAGSEPKVVAENKLGDEFTAATPVFVDGQILIRTFEHLYCIAKQ